MMITPKELLVLRKHKLDTVLPLGLWAGYFAVLLERHVTPEEALNAIHRLNERAA